MPQFELDAAYSPSADQPAAIDSLAEGLGAGDRFLTLLGGTGTGKTMTMASTIERVQRPTLVIAHNKTLAAQLCNEFRTYFPHNAVEYFVSYYDYYQPEAYVPSRGPLHREGLVDQPGDRAPAPRRHRRAARAPRRDHRRVGLLHLRPGLAGDLRGHGPDPQAGRHGRPRRRCFASSCRSSTRATTRRWAAATSGCAARRSRSSRPTPETAYRASLFGDEVERLQHFDPLTGEILEDDLEHLAIWPATHYNVRQERDSPTRSSRSATSSNARCAELEAEGKLLESHRLRQRTQYDMEMLRELGFCSGIENYSRILDGRAAGERPYCLIDYFPGDFVCFIDESHQTVPQIGGMYEGDHSRKRTLVDYGFRLPSALDNRPQTFDEFLSITAADRVRVGHAGRLRAQPRRRAIVEQIVRPTGVVDPEVEVRETQEPDRRPDERDPPARGGERAHAGHHAHEEDERGPHRLPARDGLQGALPALARSTRSSASRSSATCAWASTTCSSA